MDLLYKPYNSASSTTYRSFYKILSGGTLSGADPGFQVRVAHLKKLRRAEGGANFFLVFRVKNHDFTPKNHIFSNFKGGGAPGAPPPLDPPLTLT